MCYKLCMKFKTIIISDLHIGSLACKADQLLAFLKKVESKKLILNGDIIDGWRLKRRWYFPQSHLLLIRKFLSIAKRDVEVVYVSGNHDEFIRKFHGYDIDIGNVRVVNEHVHIINGKKFLVVHGDWYDVVTRYHAWIAKLGDHAYELSVWVNDHFNKLRILLGMRYWSLSRFLKNKVKGAVKFIFAFEHTAVESAKQRQYDGVICGHIHSPNLMVEKGIVYVNAGDWVETCSWIGETEDGKLQIWEWNSGEPKLIKELTV